MSSARVNPVSPPWQFANAKIGPFSLGDFALADKWLSTSIAVPQARIGHCQFYNISNCSRVVIVIAISQCITPSKAPFGDYSCVGYATRDVVRGSYNMLAIQFNDVGSIVDAGNIANAIKSDLPALDYVDYDLPDFPQIMIKTSDTSADYGKKFFYYCDSEYDETSPGVFEALPAGWYDYDENEPTVSDLIALGRGFWLIIPNDNELYPNSKYTITFNGQVADADKAISVPVVNGGYIIAANPFPAPLDIGNIAPSAGVPALDYVDYDLPDFPQVMIKTSDVSADYGKKFFYYCDSEYDETSPGVFEALPAGWYDYDENEPGDGDKIAVGNSFWIVIPDDCLPDDKQTFSFSL